MPEPLKKKVKANDDSSAELDAKVSEYMKKQNRPYSLINVFDNLRAAYSKPQLQLSLDRLAEEPTGLLIGKSYGAQKFFYCKQDIFGDCSTGAVKQVETEVGELSKQLAACGAETADLLGSCPTSDAQLSTQRDKALSDLAAVGRLVERLAAQTAQTKDLAVDFERQLILFGEVREESDKRKRMCMRLLDFWGESLSMTRIDLAQELGCELCL